MCLIKIQRSFNGVVRHLICNIQARVNSTWTQRVLNEGFGINNSESQVWIMCAFSTRIFSQTCINLQKKIKNERGVVHLKNLRGSYTDIQTQIFRWTEKPRFLLKLCSQRLFFFLYLHLKKMKKLQTSYIVLFFLTLIQPSVVHVIGSCTLWWLSVAFILTEAGFHTLFTPKVKLAGVQWPLWTPPPPPPGLSQPPPSTPCGLLLRLCKQLNIQWPPPTNPRVETQRQHLPVRSGDLQRAMLL